MSIAVARDDIPRLTRIGVERKAYDVLSWYDPRLVDRVCTISVLDIAFSLHKRGKLQLRLGAKLGSNKYGQRIHGGFNLATRDLLIDEAVGDEGPRFRFVLAHELGHFVLHRKLNLDWSMLDEPTQSINDSWRQIGVSVLRRKNRTDRDWLEWQANTFAASLLMPAVAADEALRRFQTDGGVRRVGRIYLDNQHDNTEAYFDTIRHLTGVFNTSRTTMIYRLKSLGLLQDFRPGFSSTWMSTAEALTRADLASLLTCARDPDFGS